LKTTAKLLLSLGAGALAWLAMPAAPARAQDDDAADPRTGRPPVQRFEVEIDARARKAISRGLDFLARRQEPDGSFVDGIGRKVNNMYLATPGPHVGVTALAGMAFLSNGSTPGRGQYGKNVQGCVDFIKATVNPQGFATHMESRMYEHAFATLFMAEVYGMAPSEDLLKSLKRAVNLIVRSQNEQGGWRYLPGAKDSDISITVCQVQALRAANNVGVQVPKETIDAAIRYVKRSYVGAAAQFNTPPGGFWYQVYENYPLRPSRTSFALTAAGVTALYGAGEYDGPEIRGGLRYLFELRNRPQAREMDETFDYFYGHYYAIQAFFQSGEPYWSQWYPSVRDELVAGQKGDGRWQDLVGPNYATSMACVILQIPYRYLPIFER
jgi:hypothetical protein